MTQIKPRTIAEILAGKTPEEREEWLRKDAIQEAASSAISGVPIDADRLFEKFKADRLNSNPA